MAKQTGHSDRTTSEKLRDLQHEILVAAASSPDLGSVFCLLCQRVEELAPGTICSVLRIDGENLIRPLAAPSLPGNFGELLDGLPIGPSAGSSGNLLMTLNQFKG